MGIYLENTVPFQLIEDRKKLVGKFIRYLRECDIDRSGRGMYFPRIGLVKDAKGVNLIMDDGIYLTRGELREVEIIGDADG